MKPARAVYDLAVVGSAFAGSLTALIARRLGRSVVLIERGRHPRYVIGESSTPLTNLLLEELAHQFDLPRVQALTKWGTWQRTHPGLAAGLKRGFSFYHHTPGTDWSPCPDHSNEFLMAASANDETSDTHWFRPEFDHFFQQEAVSLGADYFDETELKEFENTREDVRLAGTRRGEPVAFRARFLVDASGARGFLWRILGLKEASFTDYPETEALYSHFTGIGRWENAVPQEDAEPPYPPDDAALHHVFPGGWMWILPFNNGITSAGVSVSRELARELALEEGEPAWERLRSRLPSVARQLAEARPLRPFTHLPRLSFRSPVLHGPRWVMLPSAAGFLDPLLSTGFALTLQGIQRLAVRLKNEFVPSPASLASYAEETSRDLEIVAELIGALHRNLHRPVVFQSLMMLYFTAATFAETARRLGPADRTPAFLLRDRPQFHDPALQLCAWARQTEVSPKKFSAAVHRTIQPFNVAGLMNPERRNWYPVDLEALLEAGDKLGATRSELVAMLHRSGLAVEGAHRFGP